MLDGLEMCSIISRVRNTLYSHDLTLQAAIQGAGGIGIWSEDCMLVFGLLEDCMLVFGLLEDCMLVF